MDRCAEANPALTGPRGSVGPDGATDALLTAGEVAAQLRVTKGWLYAETRAGRVPHVRLGRYLRYRRSAIERWLEALEEESVTARRPSPGDVRARGEASPGAVSAAPARRAGGRAQASGEPMAPLLADARRARGRG